MIEAAEYLVAEHGMAALTFKDVQVRAGQLNKSAAKYHFGSREGLIKAVLEERMAPVDARRRLILDELLADSERPTLRQLVETHIHPLAEHTLLRTDSRYARFLVQALFDPKLAEIIWKQVEAESFRQVTDMIVATIPAPAGLARLRADQILTHVIVTLATWEAKPRSRSQSRVLVLDLVETSLGIARADVSPSITSFFGASQ